MTTQVQAGAALTQTVQRLAAAGVDTPRLDAELLLAHILGRSRAGLLAHPEQILTPGQLARLHDLAARRAARQPLAYLTGSRWFFGREFAVTPAVLIPRPETELLVELALPWLAARGQTGASVVDVGVGSGAIIISLAAAAVGRFDFHACDLSPAALAVAQANAARHGVGDRIHFHQGDLLAPLPGPVDLILANLPYVGEDERESLMPEVREHEPALALFSGPHGLHLIQRLLAQAPAYLRAGGCLLLEIGSGQAAAVAELAGAAFPAAQITCHPDLAGHDRVLHIQTAPTPDT
ncbi:MAG: peptide chain release factor N(5)-glutamine methyltransferase [Caldilineales bacterium]|nr:peptide chain release factor N(5)-glutamine methyltransferase [Caldilineales bacterium]